MIALGIFYLHALAAAVLFTAAWQREGLKGGFTAVGFLALIFSAGWPMATFLLTLVSPPGGLAPWLDRDAMALLLLSAVEIAGFQLYLGRRRSRRPQRPAEGGVSRTLR